MALSRDRDGFRLRGLEMTRIETFTDAAFAFALTLLVISLEPPTTMDTLRNALINVPGFLASATLLMVFWAGHHRWSRRYGLDDGTSIVLSCLLVFTVLVFVYPLRYMTAVLTGFIAMVTGLPIGPEQSALGIRSVRTVNEMFVIYGIGFTAMALAVLLLNLHAWRCRDQLELNARERATARGELGAYGILIAAGVLSTLIAALFPDAMPTAGWAYAALGAVMPLYGRYTRRRAPAGDESGGAVFAATAGVD